MPRSSGRLAPEISDGARSDHEKRCSTSLQLLWRHAGGLPPARTVEATISTREAPLLAPVDGDVIVGIFGAEILVAGADQAVVVELLDHVGGPATDPRDSEDGREQIYVNA